MPLSRLDNFLKNARGNILYVSPNDLDATDSIENQGNSLTRPFKTIQRALIEASRFSYQRGLSNDRFGQTTILLYPGDHIVDNRPGWIPDGANNFRLRDGSTSNDLPPFDLTTSFDLENPDNELYKLNSIHGGVIVPRGTSIVGLDLRKTKIRPKYVPNPTNDNIERSCLFRVTGAGYFWQFSMFDSDPNGQCYIDYSKNLFVPNFSHHKLSCFEYADGVNSVSINDDFQTYSTDRTDLDMYYEKVGIVYGQASGRAISPDYPSANLDIEPKIDEYRIVGPTSGEVGITSIRAGDGVTPTTTITVTISSTLSGLDVDTPFVVSGVTADGYDGKYVVSERLSETEYVYRVQNAPLNALPSTTGATITLNSDSVTSASPYIFNVSLRSVYGMCGVLADGSKASGFKSMVIAQFTGIGLQKDDNAFVLYNEDTGQWEDNTVVGNTNLSTNSRSVYKPTYRNFHIKCINDAFIQNVSIFAIGYAEHFSVESGGDMSVTNSNSNFGAKALVASGFRKNAFPQDDLGYITHIIPPKEIDRTETAIEFNSIDVEKTVGVASTAHLYLYSQSNQDVPPENVIEGYRIGTKTDDSLNVLIPVGGTITEYSSRIVMPGSQSTSEKVRYVGRSSGINSITSNTITFTEDHNFINGESVRVVSDSGQLPDGIDNNKLYFAIVDTVNIGSDAIKIAATQSDALSYNNTNPTNLEFNSNGGVLKVVSRVSDKNSGDIGHPIQYNTNEGRWYVNVSTSSTDNTIYPALISLGTTSLGASTPRTYFSRRKDNRNSIDTIYRLRYVIPSTAGNRVARPPSDGYIIQESNTSIGATTSEIQTYFGTGSLSNSNEQRNFRFIADARWETDNAIITTEQPHDLNVGSLVELINVKSSENSSGISGLGYNRSLTVTGISSAKEFSVGLNTDPGVFQNDTTTRDTNLPYFKRKNYKNTYYLYRSEEVQEYISGEQDGIYYITVLNSSNSPTVTPFNNEKFSQPVKELYPQTNRDNPKSDPQETKSFAKSDIIGEVIVNDPQRSITKENTTKKLFDLNVGVGITDVITSVGGTVHEIRTEIEHRLNRLTSLSIVDGGSGYGRGSGSVENYYNARLVGFAGSTTGLHATAKITVDASGTITDVIVMDGGSAYGIGNTLAVVGVATTSGYSQAVVQVDSVYDNTGDVIRVSGVSSDTYQQYNDLYRITTVNVGTAKSFIAQSANTISGVTTTGISEDINSTDSSYFYLTGESIKATSLTYDNQSGIGTIVSSNRHGLKVDAKVRIVGANQDLYNGSFIVNEINSQTSFSVNIGVSTNSPSTSGNIFVYREGFASNDGVINIDNENLNGRMVPVYAGITTTLITSINDSITEQINITNLANLDLRIGDYLSIDDEVVRVKGTVTSNPIDVFRGVLGTKATNHAASSVVRKVRVYPIEFRRHSIIRASAHTFEYVGFGPGNYSTAFPDKQDRQISINEELLAQSTRKEGGINFYTGMNDRGISYTGNKRLSSVTGEEEIFDTPVQTITGEDIGNLPSINVLNGVEANLTRSIKVEGGIDNKVVSEFNGPVVFGNKVTSTSVKGFEANSLFLQGDATVSRKYTVGISAPVLAGNPGDVVFNASPSRGGQIGWVFTDENDWRLFGNISLGKERVINIFDAIGIGTTAPTSENQLLIGSGTTQVSVNYGGEVGLGVTSGGYKLNVDGNVNISGTCYAGYFAGDGSALVNLQNDSLWAGVDVGLGTGIYPIANSRVGIGTTVPQYDLHLGSVGTGNTDLYLENKAVFNGQTDLNHVNVSGALTATTHEINSASGKITTGIITATSLYVGSGTTTIHAVNGQVGFGTLTPRANIDFEGSVRFKSYSENVETLSIVANTVTIDLLKAQTFILDATTNVVSFTLINVPSGSTSFTVKIAQNSIGGNSVGIDTFRTAGGSIIPVYWPGGGVVPIVTTTANRSDIYSFKTFDGGNTLHGVTGGQNFA